MAKIELKGLEGLKGLSGDLYNQWRNELISLGKLTNRSSWTQQDALYRNLLFVNRFGMDAFNSMDYNLRNKVFELDVLNTAATDLLKDEDEETIYRVSLFTPEILKEFLLSDYKTKADILEEDKKSKLIGKSTKSFLDKLLFMMDPKEYMVSQQGTKELSENQSKVLKQKNLNILKDLEVKNSDLIVTDNDSDINSRKAFYLSLIDNDLLSEKDLTDKFWSLFGKHQETFVDPITGLRTTTNPVTGKESDNLILGSRYFLGFKDSHILRDMSQEDKIKFVAMYEQLRDNYGELMALNLIEVQALNYIADKQEFFRDWVPKTIAGITTKAVSGFGLIYTIGRAGYIGLTDGALAANEYMEGKGPHVMGFLDDPSYWNGMDLFGTMSVDDIKAAYENGGILDMKYITRAGEELDWFTGASASNMMSMMGYMLGTKGYGALAKGAVGAKALATSAAKGEVMNALARRYAKTAMKSGSAASFIGHTEAVLSAALISEAYSDGVRETVKLNLTELIDKEKDALVLLRLDSYMKSPEAQSLLDNYVLRLRKLWESLLNSVSDAAGVRHLPFDEKLVRAEGKSLLQRAMFKLFSDEIESTEDILNKRNLAEASAAKAMFANGPVEFIKTFGMLEGPMKWMLSNTGRRGISGIKPSAVESTEKGLLRLKSPSYWKSAAMIPISGAEDNYLDDVVSDYGIGFGMLDYYDVTHRTTDPNVWARLGEGLSDFSAGVFNATQDLTNSQKLYDAWVGAGGSVLSFGRGRLLEKGTELRPATTLALKIDNYLHNPIIRAIAEALYTLNSTIDAVNAVIEHNRQGLEELVPSISTMSDLLKATAEGNVLNLNDAKMLHLLMAVLNLLKLHLNELAVKSNLVSNTMQTINDVAEGNFSTPEAAKMIETYIGLNTNLVGTITTEEALELLQKNAQKLLETAENYTNEIKSLNDNPETKNISLDVKNQIAYMKAMKLNWQDRLYLMSEEVPGAVYTTGGTTIQLNYGLELGNTKAIKTELNANNRYIELATKRLKKLLEEIEDESISQEDKNRKNFAIEGLQHTISILEERLLYLQDAITNIQRIKDEGLSTILTEDEIMSLNPVDRARMLAPENKSNYSKALLKIIDKLVKSLKLDNPANLLKLQDIATLQERLDNIDYTLEKTLENPESMLDYMKLKSQVMRVLGLLLMFEKAVQLGTKLLDLAFKNGTEILVARQMGIPMLDEYAKKHPRKAKALLSVREVLLLDGDFVQATKALFPNESDLALRNSLILIANSFTNSTYNKLDALAALEEALDALQDSALKGYLDAVLNKVLELGYQRDATKIRQRDEETKRLELNRLRKSTRDANLKPGDISTEYQSANGNIAYGKYSVNIDLDGFTHIKNETVPRRFNLELTQLMGLSIDDVIGTRDSYLDESNYEELANDTQTPFKIENITIRPNGEVVIDTDLLITVEGKAALTILELLFPEYKLDKTTTSTAADWGMEIDTTPNETEIKVPLSRNRVSIPLTGNYYISFDLGNSKHKITGTTAHDSDLVDAIKTILEGTNYEQIFTFGRIKDTDIKIYDSTGKDVTDLFVQNIQSNELGTLTESTAADWGFGPAIEETHAQPLTTNLAALNIEDSITVDNDGKVTSPTIEEQVESYSHVKDSDVHSSTMPTASLRDSNALLDISSIGTVLMPANIMTEYNIDTLRNEGRVEHRVGKKEGDTMNQYYKWLSDNGIHLLDIVDNELGNILQENPDTKVHFLFHNTNHPLSNMVTLAVEYTPTIARLHNELNGGVLEANGKRYLVVGTFGYTPSKNLKPTFDYMTGLMRAERATYFANNPNESYFVSPTYHTLVYELTTGFLVKLLQTDSEVQFRSLAELANGEVNERNPQGLSVEDLKWGILVADLFKTIGVSSRNIHYPPKSSTDSNGRVYAMIPSSNGIYIPVYIRPTMLNELRDGTLKDLIYDIINNLTSTDYLTRLTNIKRLCTQLVLGEDRNILIGNDLYNTISIMQNGVITKTFLLGSNFNRAEFLNTIELARFRINITLSALKNPSEIKLLSQAGALDVDIAKLGTSGSLFTVYPCDTTGNPITTSLNNWNQGNTNNGDLSNRAIIPSVSVQGNTYRLIDGVWKDALGNIIDSNSSLGILISWNNYIQTNNLEPATTIGNLDYYIINQDGDNSHVIIRNNDNRSHQISEYRGKSAIDFINNLKEQRVLEERTSNAELAILLELTYVETTSDASLFTDLAPELLTVDLIAEQQLGNFTLPTIEELVPIIEEKAPIVDETVKDINEGLNLSLDSLLETKEITTFAGAVRSREHRNLIRAIFKSKGWEAKNPTLMEQLLKEKNISLVFNDINDFLRLLEECF